MGWGEAGRKEVEVVSFKSSQGSTNSERQTESPRCLIIIAARRRSPICQLPVSAGGRSAGDGGDMTKVLREANSPGRDKEDLGLLSGSCQIAGSQALDGICNRWKAAKHKGKLGQERNGTTKGEGGRRGSGQKGWWGHALRAKWLGLGRGFPEVPFTET